MSNKIIRRDPITDSMSTLRDAMDRLFDSSFVRFPFLVNDVFQTMPAIEMYETDKDVVVKAAVAGARPDDIQINVAGNTLTITGEIKQEEKREDKNFYYQERQYGSFRRAVTLPVAVVTDKADARFENGVLTVTLPKSKESMPKVITIKAKSS